ncbi:hypothetical protein Droror1_Dr00009940 [Drosera rotundifolia]
MIEEETVEKRGLSVKDLVEETKKRAVILGICVVGLSYLMSLTSSSVWVNLPAAASLIVFFRYLVVDFEMRRKAAVYNNKSLSGKVVAHKAVADLKGVAKRPNWRRKVNSPVVEDAIDKFTRHLISEWVTDLWYSRLTPDREGPEELVQILNGAIGEVSDRMRSINLIDLLTRDVIHLVCNHLELFRSCQAKIEREKLESLNFEQRDVELRHILAAENKLHPALFSAESEHKVLLHLVDSLISVILRPDDLRCSFFHYVARELLACAVLRPVINLANPRFINERIELLVISMRNSKRGTAAAEDTPQIRQNGPSKISPDHFSRDGDPSVTGVELVQLKNIQSKKIGDNHEVKINGKNLSIDPLLLANTTSTRSWGSLPDNSQVIDNIAIQRSGSGGEWGDVLENFSRRKTQTVTPENIENMWTKGRTYRNKEAQVVEQGVKRASASTASMANSSNMVREPKGKDNISHPNLQNDMAGKSKVGPSMTVAFSGSDRAGTQATHNRVGSILARSSSFSVQEDDEHSLLPSEIESESSAHFSSEEESSVTGLDTPTTKVWDGRSNRNSGMMHIRHPLESRDGKRSRRASKQHNRVQKSQTGGVNASQKFPMWQEVERKSLLSGDGQDILSPLKHEVKEDNSSVDYDFDVISRVQNSAGASSSPRSESLSFTTKSNETAFFGDAFLKLKCDVLGANIVKSSSKTFAVYSISVTDANNNSWSIKRRFRHFEELHRRLKERPEYNLHLPPKHFLSAGMDVPVILDRCKLLDRYLKKLLQLPTIAGSIEVWDFLSVDSQTYMFSSAFSIVETLSVNLDDKPPESSLTICGFEVPIVDPFKSRRDYVESDNRGPASRFSSNNSAGDLISDGKGLATSPVRTPVPGYRKQSEDRGTDSNSIEQGLGKNEKEKGSQNIQRKSGISLDAAIDPSLPAEWVPPNLSAPILDLVDVIFQLQEGGWIRRKAFWVAKQILQLGMGDALDDWLIAKIQLLRTGPIVAAVIQRVEQILWPDGIFLTKHPKRRRPSLPGSLSVPGSPSQNSPHYQLADKVSSPREDEIRKLDEQLRMEVDRRAKFVYDTLMDNAPAAVVGLIGRKEYEQCAKDLYFFIQSSVCLKQLMLDLVELVLVAVLPEMEGPIKQLHEEKERFGEFRPT